MANILVLILIVLAVAFGVAINIWAAQRLRYDKSRREFDPTYDEIYNQYSPNVFRYWSRYLAWGEINGPTWVRILSRVYLLLGAAGIAIAAFLYHGNIMWIVGGAVVVGLMGLWKVFSTRNTAEPKTSKPIKANPYCNDCDPTPEFGPNKTIFLSHQLRCRNAGPISGGHCDNCSPIVTIPRKGVTVPAHANGCPTPNGPILAGAK